MKIIINKVLARHEKFCWANFNKIWRFLPINKMNLVQTVL